MFVLIFQTFMHLGLAMVFDRLGLAVDDFCFVICMDYCSYEKRSYVFDKTEEFMPLQF